MAKKMNRIGKIQPIKQKNR